MRCISCSIYSVRIPGCPILLIMVYIGACAGACVFGITGCTPRLPVVFGKPQTELVQSVHTPTALPFTATLPAPTATVAARPTPTSSPFAATPTVVITTATPLVPTPTLLSLEDRQQLFDQVWSIVYEHYLYADFRGVDWHGVRSEFAPQIALAESNEEFYALLSTMVQQLGDQHSRFLAPSAVEAENALTTGMKFNVGIGVVTLPTSHGVLIRQIFPHSPAAQADLRPRDRIVAVDGVTTNVSNIIAGPEGTQVRLSVIRPGEDVRDVVITRQPVEGRITPVAQRLDGDIGYLVVNTLWVHDMHEQVSGVLTDLVVERPLHGLILDLRSNPGGWRTVLSGILSHFVRGEAGAFFDQDQVMPFVIEPGSGPDLHGLPLAVLVDRGTASYAELLAAILQTEANAVVIGLPLTGNIETIYAYDLAGGARLWVAQEGFLLRNGINLEGQGLQPDVLIDLDWTRYSQETDPHIVAALQYLNGY